MLCGIGPRHIRRLCDSSWDGGFGYRPEDVGRMTLDTVFFLLADKKVLRGFGRQRVTSVPTLAAPIGSDGKVRGRAADGTVIRAKVGGESKAAMIRRKKAEERRQNHPGGV